jgi:chorismate synthase
MRFLTAGESHGQALTVILEGCPAGLGLSPADIDRQLARRQQGFGRGARQRIEEDRVQILSGVRHGQTLGSPISLMIPNRDHRAWSQTMAVESIEGPSDRTLTLPRPGHADLAGALKYDRHDARDILERASARETAARVAAGAVARRLLEEAGIGIASSVVRIGPVEVAGAVTYRDCSGLDPDLPMPDPEAKARAMAEIEAAGKRGDTLGGKILVVAAGVPPGLGSHVQWDRKLDARLALHFMSIQSVKAVEVGDGVAVSASFGKEAHDAILYSAEAGFHHPTNRAGGVEGGMANGEEIRVTAYLKPLATLMDPLSSADLNTKASGKAQIERSDVCAVPAAAVIGEAAMALCLCEALQEKCGGDSLEELLRNLRAYREQVRRF